jgi:hypothetical protein
MLTKKDLIKIARARLIDANVLYKKKRYDGAVYLCGYAIELRLKYCICKTLVWNGFPSNKKEFEGYKSFKIHDLDILLHLSGKEIKVKTEYLTDWSNVAAWDPEARYNIVGKVIKMDATTMIRSTTNLLKILV